MVKYPEGCEQKQLTNKPSKELVSFATIAQQCRSLNIFLLPQLTSHSSSM